MHVCEDRKKREMTSEIIKRRREKYVTCIFSMAH